MRSVLLAVLVLSGTAAAQVLKPEEIYQKLLPSVLTLHVENGHGERFIGAAFLGLDDGIAVTSWHVISDATNVSASLSDNRIVGVLGLVDKDEKHDLALIRLDLAGHHPVLINAAVPPIGSRAYVIGAPKGFEFSITDGLVSQIQKVDGYDQFQISCPISGGNSGGPLINDRGEVIGITSWTKRDAQNLSFATPASYLAVLNPALPAVPWAPSTALTQARTPVPAQLNTSAAISKNESEKGIAEFKQYLRKSIGKHLTVVVIDDEEEKEFDIDVPADLVKAP